MKTSSLNKSFFAALGFTLVLSGCGNEPLEAPDVVLKKAKEAMIAVNSGQMDIVLDLKGDGDAETLDVSGSVGVAFDGRKKEEKKMDMTFKLSGQMKAQDKTMNGDLDFQFISIGDQYYVKLNQFTSNDESLASFEPFINLYKEKWLRIAEDFIPENIRNLQSEDEATELKRKQLEDLFVQTEFFTVSKEYGVEKVEGEKTYRYALTPNREEFKNYMTKASLLEGQQLTEAEVEQAISFLENLEQVEFFIDTDDYSVRKASFDLAGAPETADANLEANVTLTTSNFNESVDIKAPESSEEFNPLNLIMGLGSLPGAATNLPVPPATEETPEATPSN